MGEHTDRVRPNETPSQSQFLVKIAITALFSGMADGIICSNPHQMFYFQREFIEIQISQNSTSVYVTSPFSECHPWGSTHVAEF